MTRTLSVPKWAGRVGSTRKLGRRERQRTRLTLEDGESRRPVKPLSRSAAERAAA